MSLLDRADRAFDEALKVLGSAPARPLAESLAIARADLTAPMRVAVIGQVKAGKSTLMNALLGDEVAPTGPEELTYNVNTFVHAAEPALTVHFRDGRPSERRPFDWFRQLVDRKAGDPDVLRAIAHVEVGLPNAILERLQLIDTPGFGSFFGTDSRNTLEFLGLTTDDLDHVTRAQASGADAVAYLFARGVAAADRDLAAGFEGAAIGDFTPVNAIAVLTKADAYWSAESPDKDPMVTGLEITGRIKAEPGVERIFFDVLPVCGLLAAGAATLGAADVEALTVLARLAPGELARRMKNARRFVTTPYDDISVTPEQRFGLMSRLDLYGIWLATARIRDGVSALSELRDELLRGSGLGEVRDLLLSHYSSRAALIKVSGTVNRSRALCSRAAQESHGAVAAAVATAAGRLEAFEVDEHAVAELVLLRQFYRDEAALGLSAAEGEELLTVSGERGGSCFRRLGADAQTPLSDMVTTAQDRVAYWDRRADQFGLASTTLHAARQIRRSYEVVAYHVEAAQQHLEMTI
jgi:Dynamin family